MVVSNVHVLARVHRASDAAIPAARALAGAVFWGGGGGGGGSLFHKFHRTSFHRVWNTEQHGATRSSQVKGKGTRVARTRATVTGGKQAQSFASQSRRLVRNTSCHTLWNTELQRRWRKE